MKNRKKSTVHILLLLGALVLAFSFRLIRLGATPLSDSEAEIALEALSIARGSASRVGAFPTIVGLTGIDFFIFKSGDFLARFWTAIFGGMIVILPFLFRERIGLWGASVSSFILAIAPELVGPARLIGTPMTATVCLLLGLGFLFQRKPVLTGLFMSLGLMSGPGFWFGILILGLSFFVSDWLFDTASVFHQIRIENKSRFWLRFGLAFGMVILVVGTGFSMAPYLLSGVLSGLVQLVRGIFQPAAVPFELRLIALIAYAAVAFVFGLWGGIRGLLLRNKLDLFLVVWAGFGLVFYLAYPAGTPSYLVWVSLPLWLLAARAFTNVWRFPKHSRLVLLGTAVLVVVVSAFMLLALRTLIRPGLTQNQQLNTFIALIGGLILLVAVVLLINFGWAEHIALSGLLSGLAIVLLLGLVAMSVNMTSLSLERSYELWSPTDLPITSEWLKISIDRVLNWNELRNEPIEIAAVDFESPALEWALRDYETVDFVPYLPPKSRPGILITDVTAIPEIASAYRGQDLVWSHKVPWEEMTAFQYLDWMITRKAPTQVNQIILWVRTDLLPDEQFSP